MTTTTPTTAELEARLKDTPCGYTYDGIPVFELGDDAELVITIGHVDKAAFAQAYDAYLEEVCGPDRFKLGQCFTVEEFVAEADYRKARIRPMEEFPHGEFEVDIAEDGDVDVTVRCNV